MAKSNYVQTNFNAGEFSPHIIGRTDLAKYRSGCKTLENFLPLVQGGITRRPGTRFVAKTKDTQYARPVPFQFNVEQAYILEFGHQYVRFHRSKEQINEKAAVSEGSWADSTATLTLNEASTGEAAHADSTTKQITIVDKQLANVFPVGYYIHNSEDDRYFKIIGSYNDGTNTIIDLEWDSATAWDGLAVKAYQPHQYIVGQSVTVANSDPAGYNGTHTITAINVEAAIESTTFDFTASSGVIEPDGAASPSDDPFASVQIGDKVTMINAVNAINNNTFTVNDIDTGDGKGITVDEPIEDETGDTCSGTHIIVNPVEIQYAVVSELLPYEECGTVTGILEISSPYASSDLPQIKWAQSANTLYVVHPQFQPREFKRVADTEWTVGLFDFSDGPWLDTNTSTLNTMEPDKGSGNGIRFTTLLPTFTSQDVGRLIRVQYDSKWGYAKITGFVSSLIVTADIKEDFDAYTAETAAATDWRLGAWYDADDGNWPSVVSFHQNRLWFSNTKLEPQTLWGSVVGDFTNYQPTHHSDATDKDIVGDDDGTTFTISDNEVNVVQWIKSTHQGLMVFTQGGEHLMRGSSAVSGITPTSVSVRKHGGISVAARAEPIEAGSSIIFVERAGRTAHELTFSFANDKFIMPDLNSLASHILESEVIDTAYQQEPLRTGWFVTANGLLAGLTFEKEQQVVAWHRHALGGER